MGKVVSEFGNIVGGGSTIQVATIPTYTDVSLGTIVQYIGATNANYTNGYFYKRGASGWENINVQEGSSGEAIFTIALTGEGTQADPYVVDKTPAEVDEAYASGKCIQLINTDGEIHILKSTYEYNGMIVGYLFAYTEIIERSFGIETYQDVVISKKVNLWMETDSTWEEIEIKQGEVPYTQVSELRVVGSEFVGTAYQYMGTTNSKYIHGCFYECVPNGLGGYQWQRLDVQPSGSNEPLFFDITVTEGHSGGFSADVTPAQVSAAWNSGKMLRVIGAGDLSGIFTFASGSPTFGSYRFEKINFDWTSSGGNRTDSITRTYVNLEVNNSSWIITSSRDGDFAIQVLYLPTASSNVEGKVYQYLGATDANYTHGYFYKCVKTQSNPDVYGWEQIDVQPTPPSVFTINVSGEGTQESPYVVDKTPAEVRAAYASGKSIVLVESYHGNTMVLVGPESNNRFNFSYTELERNVITQYRLVLVVSSQTGDWEVTDYTTGYNIPQVNSLPVASRYVGRIMQYTGTTNANYTHGYYYESVSNGSGGYTWEQIDVQPSSSSVFTITITGIQDEQTEEWTYSVDKTPAEVKAAYDAGKTLIVYSNSSTEDIQTGTVYQLNYYSYDNDNNNESLDIYFNYIGADDGQEYGLEKHIFNINIVLYSENMNTWDIEINFTDVNDIQFRQMPADSDILQGDYGSFIQYIGPDSGKYKQGYFYVSRSETVSGVTRHWFEQIDVQPHQNISGKADMPIEITYAAYQLLSEQDKNTHRYIVTDYPSVGGVAIDDTTTANNKVYSSEKVAELVTDLDIKENILGKLPVEISAVNDELVNKPDTTQYIILYVDDARSSLPTIWSVIKEYNIPINLAVPTYKLNATCVDGRKVKEVLHEMEDAGCEIVSHSTSDDPFYSQTTRAEAYARLKNSKEALLTEGFKVHGFAKPGNSDDFTECGFDDLVRELYLYSDTLIFPIGIHRRRSTLVQSGVTIQNILNSIKRGKNGQRLFCHGFDSDVTEEYLREFISTALAQGFVFTTEYDFYTKHSYSITNDRLLKLERLIKHYNQLDMYLMRGGLGRPIYDVLAYPYAFIYNTGDRRIVVSNASLIRDGSGNSYVYKKSDGSTFAYKRFKYASGEWVADGSSSSTTAFDSVVKGNANPEVTNYDIYDENGTLVLACEDAYVY